MIICNKYTCPIKPANSEAPYPIVIVVTCVESQKLEFNTATSTSSVSPSFAYPKPTKCRIEPITEPIKIPIPSFLFISRIREKITDIIPTKSILSYRVETGGLCIIIILHRMPIKWNIYPEIIDNRAIF